MYFCDHWYCTKKINQRCNECDTAYYCCAEHQKAAWLHHQHVCKQDASIVLDGYLVCDLIHKVIETLPSDGVVIYEKTEINDEKTEFKIYMKEQDKLTEKNDNPVLFGGNPDEHGNIAIRSYWAMRCRTSAFVMNSLLMEILKVCESEGIKQLQFHDTVIPLQDIKMDLYHIKPTNTIEWYKDGEKILHADPCGQFHYVVRVSDFNIDITTGQFWLFDQSDRPLLYLPHKWYQRFIGPKSDVDVSEEKFNHFLRNKMDEKYSNIISMLKEKILKEMGY